MVIAVVVLLLLVVGPVALVAARWAWVRRRRRLGVWWAETARPVVQPPRTLDVPALQRRIFVRCLSEVSVSARGMGVLPESFAVEVAEVDAARLGPLARIVEDELADALRTEATKRQWVLPERVQVGIAAGDAIEGRPQVRVVLGLDAVDRSRGPGDVGSPALEGVAVGAGRTAPDRTARRPTTPVGWTPPTAAAGTQHLVVCELLAADGGRDLDLTGRTDRLVVGRAGPGLVLEDERVSARHAELVPAAGGQWLLQDAGSLNGTWVNGRRVERANLVHGDEVSFAGEGPRFLFSRLAGDRPRPAAEGR